MHVIYPVYIWDNSYLKTVRFMAYFMAGIVKFKIKATFQWIVIFPSKIINTNSFIPLIENGQ